MALENQRIIATKSNFNLASRITGIVLFSVFVILPSSDGLISIILDYIAYSGIGVFLILLILHILEPRTKISTDEKQVFLHYIHKVVAIDVKAISQIRHIKKHIRGMEYSFGNIQILTHEKLFTIKHIEKVEEAHNNISQLLNKK